jgi:glutamate/tyrosine decarboxylase-like PLP-dependent enzyme
MDPILAADRAELPAVLEAAMQQAVEFLAGLDRRPAAVDPGVPEPVRLPESGGGARAALRQFEERFGARLSGGAGPRYFGFVTGGSTPAALAGDWLASAYDQNALWSNDGCAPLVELEALSFLRELFGLPEAFTGAFVSGATMANFVGLAIGRQWLGHGLGEDVAENGLANGEVIYPVFAATPHSSTVKALALLGMGRGSLIKIRRLPGREAIDPAALEAELAEFEGMPKLVVASAGTVNTTDFDDLRALGRLKEEYPFWLHVDGAFGLFAAASPRLRHLVAGLEAADSIAVDAHKWLNVPYDSAMIFTRHLDLQLEVFQNASPYLEPPLPLPQNFLHLVPENSRRFRALPAWMTLMAYGRAGVRDIVERCCELAAALGEKLSGHPAFRLLAPVGLNVVCFTLAGEADEARVKRFLQRVREDGRAFLTGTVLDGQPGIRAAFSNWRTGEADVEETFAALVEAARDSKI